MSAHARMALGVAIALGCPPALAVDGTWSNYGNNWYAAAIQGRGDTLWVSGAGGVSQYDRRTMREVARWACQDGLTGLHQFSVCEIDPETGDLWLARGNGLSRWDGTTWHHANGGACSYTLAITHENVWAGTQGLQRLDKAGKLLKTYTPANSSLPAGNLWFIRVDRDDPNFLWIAHYINPVYQGKTLGYDKAADTWWRRADREPIDPANLGGLSKWDIRAEKCTAFYNPNNSEVPTNRGGIVGEDSTGHIWFSGDEPSTGIGRMDKKTGQWEIFDASSGCPMPNWNAWSLVVDASDNVFASTAATLIGARWADTRKWEPLQIPPRVSIHPALAASGVVIGQNWNQWSAGDGVVYCATGWGVVRYDRKTRQWAWLDDLPQVGNTRTCPMLGVCRIRQDARGRVWLAGRTLGYLDEGGQMRIIPAGPTAGQMDNDFHCMEIAGNTLWALDRKGRGLLRYDIAGGPADLPAASAQPLYQRGGELLKLGLASDQPISLSQDRKGRLWFGFETPGLVQCRDVAGFRTYRQANTAGGLTGSVRCVREGPDGRLWLATSDALVEFDGQRWTRHPAESSGPKLGFTAIEFDAQGGLWLLGKQVEWETRLYRFAGPSPRGAAASQGSSGQPFGAVLAPAGAFTMLFADGRGRIWLSNRQHALLVRVGEEWQTVDPRAGGPAGVGYQCGFQGSDGRLYFGGQTTGSGGISLTVLKE